MGLIRILKMFHGTKKYVHLSHLRNILQQNLTPFNMKITLNLLIYLLKFHE